MDPMGEIYRGNPRWMVVDPVMSIAQSGMGTSVESSCCSGFYMSKI